VGNTPTKIGHIKKATARVAGPRGDVQIDCNVVYNTTDRAVFGADRVCD
jgi:hypothetical protein